LEEARRAVPKPELPPKPAGHIETTMETVEKHISVPTVKKIGGDLGRILRLDPQIIYEDQVTTTQVPVTKLVDAPPDEVKKME
jgi:hypothetical protein